MSEPPDRLRRSTAYLLTQAVRLGARIAQPMFGDQQLRFPHYVTLSFLADTPQSSQRELSAALGTDPSDLVTVLDQLSAAGLVERIVNPDDRRRRILAITPHGRAWLAEREHQAAEFERRLCTNLPDGGAELRRQLSTLLGHDTAAPERRPTTRARSAQHQSSP
jgi:DNA-binding MarR family transcriptional regulator